MGKSKTVFGSGIFSSFDIRISDLADLGFVSDFDIRIWNLSA